MALGSCLGYAPRDNHGRTAGEIGFDQSRAGSMWFKEDRTNAAARMMTLEAKAICSTCPVQSDCLTYAMDGRVDDGVWGGTTGKERKAMRRKARITSMAAVG